MMKFGIAVLPRLRRGVPVEAFFGSGSRSLANHASIPLRCKVFLDDVINLLYRINPQWKDILRCAKKITQGVSVREVLSLWRVCDSSNTLVKMGL